MDVAMSPVNREGGSRQAIIGQPTGGGIRSLGARSDDPVHIKCHQVSKWTSLRGSLLSWFHAVGVRPVLLEICSCYHRILLRRRIGSRLAFEAVRRSIPLLSAIDDSASQTGRHSYIQGIQALEKERPWLTLLDAELYLQGWFQAEKVYVPQRGHTSMYSG
jgi:hypothetical protein